MDRWFAEFRSSGDPRILARVFDRAAPELWRVAGYLCRDRHVVEDAVQGTFLSAIEARQDWDPGRPLLPWLLGLLVNRVREERRRHARRPEPEWVAAPRGEGDPAATAASEELDETLRQALLRLAEPYRSTLEQHLVQGLTATEIAGRNGVAAGTVRMRLHRGLARLRQQLPKGLVAVGGALLLTPESMAAMRATVLTKAHTVVAGAGVAAGAVASLNGKKVLFACATLLLGAVTVVLATKPWTEPPQPGTAPSVIAAGPSDRAVADLPAADLSGGGGIDAEERGGNVRELVADRTGELRVTVLTRGGLEPVRGAKLVVTSGGSTQLADAADRREGTTDADGVARFELPAGPVRVEVREPSVDSAAVTVLASDTVEQVMLVSVPFLVDLRVVDASGAAVPGARLVARTDSDDGTPDERLGEAGSDGHWRGQLPRGSFVVRAHADGRASSGAAILDSNRASLTLQVGGVPASLTGTVRDQDGRPVAGAGLVLQREVDGARSDADACHVIRADTDGRYEIDHLAAGAHTIYAWHGKKGERRIARASVLAVAARQTVADVILGDGARIVVELTRTDGQPCVGANFHAIAEQQPARGILVGRSGQTDEHGRLQLTGLPPGRYQLTATVDRQNVRETADLREGEELAFRRVIGSLAWLEVQLADADGEPLRDWVVQTNERFPASVEHDALFPTQSTRTDDRGIARFDGVPQRATWVTVSRDSVRAPVVIREVPCNARTTIVLSAAQLAQRRVFGRIGAHDVGDAATFEVSLVQLPETPLIAGGIESAVTADGSFQIDGVPAGTYGLVVLACDVRGAELGRVAWQRGIVVTGERDVDLGTIPVAITDLAVGLLRSDGAAVERPRLLHRLAPGYPFQSCKQAVRGDRVELQQLPAGAHDVLAIGDNCAPKVAQVVAPDSGRGAVLVVEPAVTVAVRCEELLREARVFRDGRRWFSEESLDVRRPYRIGLPPGTYRIEFTDARGTAWVAEFAVGSEPVEVEARLAGG